MGRRLLAAALIVVTVAGCTSSSGSSGSSSPAAAPSPSNRTSVHGGGFGRTDVGDSSVPASQVASPTPEPTGRQVTFTGSSTSNTYRAIVWGSNTVAACVTHAYGTKMIAFLTQHPCSSAHRVLATVPLEGRTVVISIISTSFPSDDANNPFQAAIAFKRLEEADCSCGLTDLLREGAVVAGFSGDRIPPHEAFTVLGQDSGVTILDAWYLDGDTNDQDKTLVALEQDVFLSRLSTA